MCEILRRKLTTDQHIWLYGFSSLLSYLIYLYYPCCHSISPILGQLSYGRNITFLETLEQPDCCESIAGGAI